MNVVDKLKQNKLPYEFLGSDCKVFINQLPYPNKVLQFYSFVHKKWFPSTTPLCKPDSIYRLRKNYQPAPKAPKLPKLKHGQLINGRFMDEPFIVVGNGKEARCYNEYMEQSIQVVPGYASYGVLMNNVFNYAKTLQEDLRSFKLGNSVVKYNNQGDVCFHKIEGETFGSYARCLKIHGSEIKDLISNLTKLYYTRLRDEEKND